MEVSEARRRRQLEEENRQLKHIVAEQTIDIRGVIQLLIVSPESLAKWSGGAMGG